MTTAATTTAATTTMPPIQSTNRPWHRRKGKARYHRRRRLHHNRVQTTKRLTKLSMRAPARRQCSWPMSSTPLLQKMGSSNISRRRCSSWFWMAMATLKAADCLLLPTLGWQCTRSHLHRRRLMVNWAATRKCCGAGVGLGGAASAIGLLYNLRTSINEKN